MLRGLKMQIQWWQIYFVVIQWKHLFTGKICARVSSFNTEMYILQTNVRLAWEGVKITSMSLNAGYTINVPNKNHPLTATKKQTTESVASVSQQGRESPFLWRHFVAVQILYLTLDLPY